MIVKIFGLAASIMIIRYIEFSTFLLICVSASLGHRNALAQLPTIELSAMSRSGGQIGTDFDVNLLSGSRTDEVDRIVFTHPGIVCQNLLEPKPAFAEIAPTRYGHFHVAIDEHVPPGLYEARVQGRFGLSNSRTFWVTKEKWSSQLSGGTTGASAVHLPMNEIIQDECSQRLRKFYHLNLQAKQAVNIRLITPSVDSRARLVVTLVDMFQKQVATSEVIESQDTEIEYIPSHSGTHTLIVSDHLFRGGPEYRYVVLASPLDDKASDTPNLIDEWRTHVLALNALEKQASSALPLVRLTPSTATLRLPLLDALPLQHKESQFANNQVCSIEFPSLVVGQFDTDRDQDWFELSLDAKSAASIEVVSERLGELTDPQLIIYRVESPGTADEKLHQIAIADDIANVASSDVRMGSRDAVLQFTASESGRYRLLVRDLQRSDHRDHRHRYALELRQPVPDVSAVAYLSFPVRDLAQSRNLAPTLTRMGTLAVAVAVTRHDGWKGPLEIQADHLPTGITTHGLTLAADQSNGHLILFESADAIASVSSFSIRMTADLQEKSISRLARPLELTWGSIATLNAPVARLTSSLVLATEARDQVPLSIRLGSDVTADVARGSKLKIPVALQRNEGGKQEVVVRLRNAPAKTKAADLKVNADKNTGELELNVPQDAPLGEFTCWAQCETKVKLKLNPEALDREQKRLAELELMKGKIEEKQTSELESSIKTQQETIKRLLESTTPQEFAVQMASSSMRLRIIEKP